MPVQVLLQRVRHAIRHAITSGRGSSQKGIRIRVQVQTFFYRFRLLVTIKITQLAFFLVLQF